MDPVNSSKPEIPRNAARWLAFGPYYGMFPVRFALNVVQEYTRPGESLLDPFAGRGTSVAAAWALVRQGRAVEVNPVAWLYGRVKIAPSAEHAVLLRLHDVCDASEAYRAAAGDMGEFYEWCLSSRAREFLLAARDMLDWQSDPVDQTLAAFILAYLHGKWGQALSNQMRQQKSMAPAYSVRWWQERDMHPPDVDPLAFFERRIRWRYAWARCTGCPRMCDWAMPAKPCSIRFVAAVRRAACSSRRLRITV